MFVAQCLRHEILKVLCNYTKDFLLNKRCLHNYVTQEEIMTSNGVGSCPV